MAWRHDREAYSPYRRWQHKDQPLPLTLARFKAAGQPMPAHPGGKNQTTPSAFFFPFSQQFRQKETKAPKTNAAAAPPAFPPCPPAWRRLAQVPLVAKHRVDKAKRQTGPQAGSYKEKTLQHKKKRNSYLVATGRLGSGGQEHEVIAGVRQLKGRQVEEGELNLRDKRVECHNERVCDF